MTEKPNLLFLFSDQHSARTLGCYGNAEVRTPHLDRLARDGVRFTNACTNNPICTPSRMSFLSGQYPHNHGYWGLQGRNPSSLPNLFSHFRRHGYTTGWAGKSHTPPLWLSQSCDFFADAMGYEKITSIQETGMFQGLQGRSDDDYSLYLERKGLLDRREDKILKEQYERFGQTMGQGVDAKCSTLPEDETVEAWIASQTEGFIEAARTSRKPFAFWMTMPHPHQTYAPAKRFWELYDEASLTLPPNADDPMEGRHRISREMQRYFQDSMDWRLYKPDDWESSRRRVLRGYYACVSQVDDAIGRVLGRLDALGIREDTIVVYSSDHGDFAGEHGMIEKAPGIGFGCITRIPFICSYPSLPKGAVRDSMIESVDFLPTVCALAGLPPPDWVDGVDLTPALMGNASVKDFAVTENPLSKTIHTKKYKLTQYLPEMCGGASFGELYDLHEDPWELRNLYSDEGYRKVLHELQSEIYGWLIRTSRHVTMNPAPLVWRGTDYHSWDVADQLYDEDGLIGRNYLAKVIEKGGDISCGTKMYNYL
ncbi:MAG: sulfatase-like hydrolase/transferase [Spirochaetota bacterium]